MVHGLTHRTAGALTIAPYVRNVPGKALKTYKMCPRRRMLSEKQRSLERQILNQESSDQEPQKTYKMGVNR